jgi:hypothetical protein
VALEHELGMAGARVPELDATILGSREHPFRVGGEGNAENKVLYRELAGVHSKSRSASLCEHTR